ncbi:MAG: hypothetical protein R3D43_13005 [Tepidamorphaceae bacterium]
MPGSIGKFIAILAFTWSAFQLYIASGVPFWVTETFHFNAVFNNSEARFVHLAFAMALATFAYPLLKGSPRDRVPVYDWVLAILAASSCLYLLVSRTTSPTAPGCRRPRIWFSRPSA